MQEKHSQVVFINSAAAIGVHVYHYKVYVLHILFVHFEEVFKEALNLRFSHIMNVSFSILVPDNFNFMFDDPIDCRNLAWQQWDVAWLSGKHVILVIHV